MNILIISNFFTPTIHIASFRIEAFAKYFSKAGHTVTIVTEGGCDKIEMWNNCSVHYLRDSMLLMQMNFKDDDSFLMHKLKSAFNLVFNFIFLDKKVFWKKRAEKYIEKLFNLNPYDVILTSYGPHAPLQIALHLKRKKYIFKWIIDMRDEMSKNLFFNRYTRYRLRKVERQYLDSSDLVLSVSDPILDGFRENCSHDNFLEVKNGYDFDEIHTNIRQPQFTLGYVGSFYGAIKPDNLFIALSQLKKEGRIPENFKFKIIGNRKPLIIPASIKENVFQYDRVPHIKAVEMLSQCDVLLIIHPTGRKGVYTGKLFDYLASNRTILALADPNDVIAPILEETNSGFIVDNADIEGIKEQIIKCYTLYNNNSMLERDWSNIKKYTRENQVAILLNFMKENWE